jgi:DNA polymerase-1
MSKLVLIDGFAILHRAYHALPKTLRTKDGKPINAVYGLVSMLLRVIQDLEPTQIAVAYDRKEPTFRKKEFKDYQSHRPEMDKELDVQIDKARRFFEAAGIPVYSKAGYEADDVIGTLAKEAGKKMDKVIIVTGDKDILQLVTDKIHVYLPKRGLSDAKEMEIQDVEAKLKVKPEQVVDYKALVGDPSDNYPGVAGIGPKTAEKLLKKYGNLENIYKNLDKIHDATRKKLKENKESAFISQKLARIVTDVDFEHNLNDTDDWSVDNQKVLILFKEFGFRTLTKRVKEVGKKLQDENQGQLF